MSPTPRLPSVPQRPSFRRAPSFAAWARIPRATRGWWRACPARPREPSATFPWTMAQRFCPAHRDRDRPGNLKVLGSWVMRGIPSRIRRRRSTWAALRLGRCFFMLWSPSLEDVAGVPKASATRPCGSAAIYISLKRGQASAPPVALGSILRDLAGFLLVRFLGYGNDLRIAIVETSISTTQPHGPPRPWPANYTITPLPFGAAGFLCLEGGQIRQKRSLLLAQRRCGDRPQS